MFYDNNVEGLSAMVCVPWLFSCHLLTVSKPNNSHHGRLAPYHEFSSASKWEPEQTFYVPEVPIFSDTLASADATSGGASVFQHNIDNDCQARLYENSATFNQDSSEVNHWLPTPVVINAHSLYHVQAFLC